MNSFIITNNDNKTTSLASLLTDIASLAMTQMNINTVVVVAVFFVFIIIIIIVVFDNRLIVANKHSNQPE